MLIRLFCLDLFVTSSSISLVLFLPLSFCLFCICFVQFTSFARSHAVAPSEARVESGRIEVVGLGPNLQGTAAALSMWSGFNLHGPQHSANVSGEADMSVMRHYIFHPFVHVDGTVLGDLSTLRSLNASSPEEAGYSRSPAHTRWLRFDKFDANMPPFALRTGDVITVHGE